MRALSARTIFSPSTASSNEDGLKRESSGHVQTEEAFREEPVFTQIATGRLFEWLDDGVASNGERYLEIRRRLVWYFERRDCCDPEALADETFNRIERTLEEQRVILTSPPAQYCYVVARWVLREDVSRRRKADCLERTRGITRT